MTPRKGDIVQIIGTLADHKELRDQLALVIRVFVRHGLPWLTVVAWCPDAVGEGKPDEQFWSDWPSECVSLRHDAVEVLLPANERTPS